MSEYAPAFQGRREYISNFTGSAGTAVITHDGAYLWTDGRYFIQAKDELGPGWTLMKSGVKGEMSCMRAWLLVPCCMPSSSLVVASCMHGVLGV